MVSTDKFLTTQLFRKTTFRHRNQAPASFLCRLLFSQTRPLRRPPDVRISDDATSAGHTTPAHAGDVCAARCGRRRAVGGRSFIAHEIRRSDMKSLGLFLLWTV